MYIWNKYLCVKPDQDNIYQFSDGKFLYHISSEYDTEENRAVLVYDTEGNIVMSEQIENEPIGYVLF